MTFARKKPFLVLVLSQETTDEQYKSIAVMLSKRLKGADLVVRKELIEDVFLVPDSQEDEGEEYKLERIVENDDVLIRLVHKVQ